MKIADRRVNIRGNKVVVTVHRISTNKFGTFGLYYATNNYGEPRLSREAYSTPEEAYGAEVESLQRMFA